MLVLGMVDTMRFGGEFYTPVISWEYDDCCLYKVGPLVINEVMGPP